MSAVVPTKKWLYRRGWSIIESTKGLCQGAANFIKKIKNKSQNKSKQKSTRLIHYRINKGSLSKRCRSPSLFLSPPPPPSPPVVRVSRRSQLRPFFFLVWILHFLVNNQQNVWLRGGYSPTCAKLEEPLKTSESLETIIVIIVIIEIGQHRDSCDIMFTTKMAE